jgi:hypothetical protein
MLMMLYNLPLQQQLLVHIQQVQLEQMVVLVLGQQLHILQLVQHQLMVEQI